LAGVIDMVLSGATVEPSGQARTMTSKGFQINRAHVAFGHDIIMAAVSFFVSLYLRLGGDIVYYADEQSLIACGLFTVVAAAVFWSMRMYRGVWRYASLNDLVNIVKAVTLAILIFLVFMFAITRLEELPRSLPFINWFVLIALLGGPRFIYRLIKDRRFEWKLRYEGDIEVPVLLAGADDAAESFIRAVARTQSGYRVVGILSATPNRVGRNIHGVNVMGTLDQIDDVVRQLAKIADRPQRLILTSGRHDGATVGKLLERAEELGMTMARLPEFTEFQGNLENGISTRPVDVEDLLGRPQTPLDRDAMARLVAGRRVVVTGAGGSIGSELTRQIAALSPSHLVMFDNSEFNLFTIDNEIARVWPNVSRRAVIGDVRERARIDALFADERPELIFHAAALKHVPLVETNRFEGFATNVGGTVNVADACAASSAAAMVLISTDKAVNPANAMGASKRIAECYCQALGRDARTGMRFITVRFGNVLGSTGSVVQLFREQIARGGPLTVTHPDMTRYFMTTREAVELVLMASALGIEDQDPDGRIFVLDMGKPVRILDLANQMIRLAGMAPGKDIAIEITGPRPGEKLFEEVFHADELSTTACKGILLAAPRIAERAKIEREISALLAACRARDDMAALAAVRALVPEYQPADDSLPVRAAN
jgi:O-antigen biosynthesis protein WbqV